MGHGSFACHFLAFAIPYKPTSPRGFGAPPHVLAEAMFASLVAVALAALYLSIRVFQAKKRTGWFQPGWTVFISSLYPLPLDRSIRGIVWERGWQWVYKYNFFAQQGRDIVAITSVLPPRTIYHTCDPVAIHHLTASNSKFPKPIEEFYAHTLAFGPHLIGVDGAHWKRMRKPISPAFGDRNARLVWQTATKVMRELFETPEWKDKPEVRIANTVDVTLRMALLVIGIAGLGGDMSWDESSVPEGHTMSFFRSMEIVSDTLIEMFIVPKLVRPLRARWRLMDRGASEFVQYIREMVHERRMAADKREGFDIFSGLLAATEHPENPLSNSELEGNLFILLLAGHETAAHTMAFTFGLLAWYQDEQQKLYEHIMEVKRALGRDPTFEDLPRFNRCLAVMQETLRLYPATLTLVKQSAEDTQLPMADGRSVYVPKDTMVEMSLVGLHYHPQHWDKPEEFRPERFLCNDWPREAYMPFNLGARACIGRKFAESETVVFLIEMFSRYRVKPQNPNITREELLKTAFSLTMTPINLALSFERRES